MILPASRWAARCSIWAIGSAFAESRDVAADAAGLRDLDPVLAEKADDRLLEAGNRRGVDLLAGLVGIHSVLAQEAENLLPGAAAAEVQGLRGALFDLDMAGVDPELGGSPAAELLGRGCVADARPALDAGRLRARQRRALDRPLKLRAVGVRHRALVLAPEEVEQAHGQILIQAPPSSSGSLEEEPSCSTPARLAGRSGGTSRFLSQAQPACRRHSRSGRRRSRASGPGERPPRRALRSRLSGATGRSS